MTTDFLGRGWTYPLRLTAQGGFALADGEDDVAEAILLILGTAYGERPMRPEYGCGIHDLVFDAIDNDLAARVAAEVRASLTRWEPRVSVAAVRAEPHEVDGHVLMISVDYTVTATNSRRNLVFPFYTIPGE